MKKNHNNIVFYIRNSGIQNNQNVCLDTLNDVFLQEKYSRTIFMLCPCQSKMRYLECCGYYILLKHHAKTPEALMRSRYTAFVEKNARYIRNTMRSPALDNFNEKMFKKSIELWTKLDIIRAFYEEPSIGYVEFKAHYNMNNTPGFIHELSEFHFDNDLQQWFYANGIHYNLEAKT